VAAWRLRGTAQAVPAGAGSDSAPLGRSARAPGLAVAGKTGTAEVFENTSGYDESRNFSSFAGVFPAHDPRYVIVVSLDGVGEGAVGGAIAAPVVARTLRRIAPMLGLRVEPSAATR